MRAMGYTVLDDHEDVLGYLTSYRPPICGKIVPALPVNRQNDFHP